LVANWGTGRCKPNAPVLKSQGESQRLGGRWQSGSIAVAIISSRFQFGVEEIDDSGLAEEAQKRLADHVGGKEIERLAGLEERFGELDGMVVLLKASQVK